MANQRRARGEGSYRSLPNGKIQYKLRHQGRERSATGETKKEAKANLERKLAGERVVPSQSFLSLAQRYRDSRNWQDTTKDNFETWLSSKVEDEPIASMKGADDAMILAWRDSLKGSHRTRWNNFRHLLDVLAFGGLRTGVQPPKKGTPVRRPMSPNEAEVFAAAASVYFENVTPHPKARLAFEIAEDSGMRRGELCGLAYEDLDESGVWVRRSVVWTKGVLKVKSPKTEKHRWVPLSPETIALIGKGKGFILGEGKTPLNPKTLSSWFYDIKIKSGLSVPYLGLHTVRRTYLMSLLETGTDLKTVAEIGGHDPKVLADIYAASRRDLKKAAVERLRGTRRGKQEGTNGKTG